jgi:hypothetical protein
MLHLPIADLPRFRFAGKENFMDRTQAIIPGTSWHVRDVARAVAMDPPSCSAVALRCHCGYRPQPEPQGTQENEVPALFRVSRLCGTALAL